MKIAVLFPVDPQERELFLRAAGDAQVDFLDKRTPGGELRDYQVLIGLPHPAVVDQAASLRYLQLTTAGVNRYVNCPRVRDRSVLLASASGAYGTGVSEWMLALTMMMFKKLHLYRDNMHLPEGHWHSHGKVRAITGSTIVCIGTGDLGTQYARRVRDLGAHVIGVCRTNARSEVFHEIYRADACDQALERADAVVMALPSTPQTVGFLSARRIAHIRPDAYIINAGRGDTVDTQALIQALQTGAVAGAALDVTDPEPLPDDSPLWQMPNVMITPHVAGGFNLDLTRANIIAAVTENLARYVGGGQPLHLVDPDRGY